MTHLARQYNEYSNEDLGKIIKSNEFNNHILYRIKHELSFREIEGKAVYLFNRIDKLINTNRRRNQYENYYKRIKEIALGPYYSLKVKPNHELSRRIIKFKNGDEINIKFFEDEIFKRWQHINKHKFTLCRVPSSNKDNQITSLNILIKNIIQRSEIKHCDGSLFLSRKYTIPSQHLSTNKPRYSVEKHLDSLEVNYKYIDLIENKIVILFDDVITTKNSMDACTEMLMKNNVSKVIQFSLSKTVKLIS